MRIVVCPLCGARKARRACPATGRQICTVCCGTKRLVEIACPSDCTWLASAREHPPAVVVRQQQRDMSVLVHALRDFSQRQSQILFLVTTTIAGYRPPDLQTLVDEDVVEAADALAATYETAARGVIYEHRPATLSAERLANALKAVLSEAGKGGGSSFERDAAAVLRRCAETARELRSTDPAARRPFVDLAGRLVRQPDNSEGGARDPREPQADEPRLIVP